MRIPTKTAETLASSAVGVPQQDRSGQIIGAGIASFGEALQKREAEKNELDGTIHASTYQQEVTKRREELQRTHRNDPMKFPELMAAEENKIAEQLGTGLSSGVYDTFKNKVTRLQASSRTEDVKWAYAADTELIKGKINKLYIDEAVRAETVQSKEGMLAVRKRIDLINEKAGTWYRPDTVAGLDQTYWGQAQNSFAAVQMETRPVQFLRELQSGQLDEIFSDNPAKKKALMTQAFNAAVFRQKTMDLVNALSGAAELADIDDQIMNGSVDPADLARRVDMAEMSRGVIGPDGVPIATDEYIEGIKNRQKALYIISNAKTNSLTKAQSKSKSDALKKQWTDTTLETYRGGPLGGDPTADTVKMLKVYNEAFLARNTGELTPEDYNDIKTLFDTKTTIAIPGTKKKRTTMTKQELIANAGKRGWFEDRSTDVYHRGWKRIKAEISALSLPEDVKQDKTLRAMAAFARSVQMMEEVPTTEDEMNKTIERIWVGSAGDKAKGKGALPGLRNAIFDAVRPVVKNGKTYHAVRIGDTELFAVDPELNKALMQE